MVCPRVMPCLLVQDGRLVKTKKFRDPVYVGDPINAIRIYNEKEVDEIIILDIEATAFGKPPLMQLISEICEECFMPMCYGGGITTVEEIKEILKLGIEKVAINTSAIENPDLITRAAEMFGSQSIVVSIDVRKKHGEYSVFYKCGQKNAKMSPADFATIVEQRGAGEILLNSIDRDGTWEGYDIELLNQVTSNVTIPVIACGGASKVEDFADAVKNGGASACAAGSMVVFQGKDLGVLINFPVRSELERVLE